MPYKSQAKVTQIKPAPTMMLVLSHPAENAEIICHSRFEAVVRTAALEYKHRGPEVLADRLEELPAKEAFRAFNEMG